MKKTDDKSLQIKLEYEISEILRADNGVYAAFDYHINISSSEQTVKLNLLTYNPKHQDYMLFHTVLGNSSIDCLQKMLTYLEEHQKKPVKYSVTIAWSKRGNNQKHRSYFRAASESIALEKFFHEKNPDDYEWSIEMNPLT